MAAPLILVVDDNDDARTILAGPLEFSGYLVAEASDGREAIRKARRLSPAAVTLDLAMAGVDGFQVAERLKADPGTRRFPLIAVTAHGTPDWEKRATQAGCYSLLQKPVHPHELLVEVRRALEGATAPPGPYPLVDGNYVIDSSALPGELARVLAEVERLDGLSHESRWVADLWEGEGDMAILITGRRKLADSYSLLRDTLVGSLWTFHGLRPPRGVKYGGLRVIR